MSDCKGRTRPYFSTTETLKEEAVLNARRSQRLFDPLFTTERMCEIFSDHGRVQSMLDFEAALARAEAHAGVLSFADKLGKTQAHALVEEASARALAARTPL